MSRYKLRDLFGWWNYAQSEQFLLRSLWVQLIRELETCRDEKGQPLPANFLERVTREPKHFEASDIYSIEVESFNYLSDHELKLRILSLRDMMASMVTPESYQLLARGFLTELSKRQDMLNEARALASRMYKRYVLIPRIESLRAKIVTIIIGIASGMAAICAAVAWVYLYLRPESQFDVGYLFSATAGACGAAVSTTMRFYKIDSRHEPLLTWMSLRQGLLSIMVSPFLGATFAILFVLMIKGGLVDGLLFPNLDPYCWKNMFPMMDKQVCLMPDAKNIHTDVAKLLTWGFISGWTERLVPDVLDKLETQAKNKPVSS